MKYLLSKVWRILLLRVCLNHADVLEVPIGPIVLSHIVATDFFVDLREFHRILHETVDHNTRKPNFQTFLLFFPDSRSKQKLKEKHNSFKWYWRYGDLDETRERTKNFWSFSSEKFRWKSEFHQNCTHPTHVKLRNADELLEIDAMASTAKILL